MLIGRNIPEDFLIQVEQGLIPNNSLVSISGRNSDVDTTITDVGSRDIIFPWLTTAIKVEAISDNIEDDAGMDGARLITIEGLDANFDLISEDVVMNGTSASIATTALFLRINKTVVKEAGLYSTTLEGSNIGTIIIRPVGGGTAQSAIDGSLIDAGSSQDFKYTIPNGHKGYLISVAANIEGNKLARVVFNFRPGASIVAAPFSSKQALGFIAGASGLHTFPNEILNRELPAKTDIWASAIAQSNNTEISCLAKLLLIKD